ncbi:MAG: polysaccharide biosynthesis/export family protein [Pyrinomonadaceae bacterium]
MTPFFNKKAQLIPFAALCLVFSGLNTVIGQTDDVRGKNNPYSPSPSTRGKGERTLQAVATVEEPETQTVKISRDMDIRPTTAPSTYKVMRTSNIQSALPVDIYKVGVGDVLFISLKSAANASGYYTVRPDGTIDFPLAGENVLVTGHTVAELENVIAGSILLYPNVQIEVKIREFGSHKIQVLGMAERTGQKSLQREAIPLYVIRAEAMVDASATKVVIRPKDASDAQSYDLHDPKTDDVLIYAGDSVEFTSETTISARRSFGVFYIAGAVNTTGQNEVTEGMTLMQAIHASGGTMGNPKKATIRRKGTKGLLTLTEHNLRAIKDGKAPDPNIQSGDMIEIAN